MEHVTINRIIGDGKGGDKNILLTFDENYLYQTGNLILSLNKYNDGLFYYIFCDKITPQMEEYLLSICKNIKIYEFTLDLELNFKQWPDLMVIRLFAPFLIDDNIKQLLYLDSDILCKANIDELFFSLPDHYVIAMAPDIYGLNVSDQSKIFYDKYPSGLYCNSGVLVINILKYKNNYSFDEIYNSISNIQGLLEYPDQDFLNYYFYDKLYFINRSYNFICHDYKGLCYFKYATNKAKLIHFTLKPWRWKNPTYLKNIYLKYSLDKTMIKEVKKCKFKGLFIEPLRKMKRILFRILNKTIF